MGTSWQKTQLANDDVLFSSALVESATAVPVFIAVGGTSIESDATLVIYSSPSGVSNWKPLVTRPDLPALTSVVVSGTLVVAVGLGSVVAVLDDAANDFAFYFLNKLYPSAGSFLQVSVSNTAFSKTQPTFYALDDAKTIYVTSAPTSPRNWNVLMNEALKLYSPLSFSLTEVDMYIVGRAGFVGHLFGNDNLGVLSFVVTSANFDGLAAGPVANQVTAQPTRHSNGLLVATTDAGSKAVLVSHDAGASWTPVEVGYDLHGIYYQNGHYWASVGPLGSGSLAVSTNGVDWTTVLPYSVAGPVVFDDLNKRYVCISYGRSGNITVFSSDDTLTWISNGTFVVANVTSPQLSGLGAWGAGNFLTFVTFFDYRVNMSRSGLVSSPDGVSYKLVSQLGSPYLYPIHLEYRADMQQFLLVNDASVWTSRDGLSWVENKFITMTTIVAFAMQLLPSAQQSVHSNTHPPPAPLGVDSPVALAVTGGGQLFECDLSTWTWKLVWNIPGFQVYPAVLMAGTGPSTGANDTAGWVVVGTQGTVFSNP